MPPSPRKRASQLRARSQQRAMRRKVHVEALEDRRLLANFNVTNTNDAVTGDTLRGAIIGANASTDRIDTIR